MKSFLNPVRGWHVLVLIVLFFSVTIGVNATFITLAMRTHPGEDVPRSYYQGLNYNETLARRHEQAELGWSATDIAYYLETGFTPDYDSAGGQMTKVIASISKLPAEDREAIAAYLLAIP